MNATAKNLIVLAAATLLAGAFAVSPVVALADDFGGWGTSYADSSWDSGFGSSYGDSGWDSGWGTSYADSSWDSGWGTSYADSDWGSGWGTSYADSDWSSGWGTSYADAGWDSGWGTSYADSSWDSGWGTSYADADWGTDWGTSYADSDWSTGWGSSYADSDWDSGWGTSYADSDWDVADDWGIAQDEWGIEQDDWGSYGGSPVVWGDSYGGGDFFGGVSWGTSWGGTSYGGCIGSSCGSSCSGSSCDRPPRCTGSSCRVATCSGSSCDDNDLNVTCDVSDTSIEEGDCVTFSIDTSGGNSPFDYSWSGDTEDEGGNHRTIEVCYDDSGTYRVTGRATDDDSDSDSDSCPAVVVDNCSGSSCDDEDFDVECEVSDRTIDEGDCVTFRANVDGGNSPFDYDWNGDIEGEDDDNRTVRVCYDDEGTYEVSVVVRDDDNERQSDSCPSVEVDNGGGTARRNTPSGDLASIDAVYLSQIPYTGPEDILVLAGFGLALAAIGIGGAVALRRRSDRKAIANRIASFKASNLTR